jgi:hypothetical protein
MLTSPTILLAQEGQYGSKPLDTLANVGAPAYTGVPGAYAQTNIGVLIARVLNAVLSVLGIVFVALLVYAGFLWMTAAGNEAQIDKAKKIMTASVIGLIIILASWSIAKFVLAALYRATSSSVI